MNVDFDDPAREEMARTLLADITDPPVRAVVEWMVSDSTTSPHVTGMLLDPASWRDGRARWHQMIGRADELDFSKRDFEQLALAASRCGSEADPHTGAYRPGVPVYTVARLEQTLETNRLRAWYTAMNQTWADAATSAPCPCAAAVPTG